MLTISCHFKNKFNTPMSNLFINGHEPLRIYLIVKDIILFDIDKRFQYDTLKTNYN